MSSINQYRMSRWRVIADYLRISNVENKIILHPIRGIAYTSRNYLDWLMDTYSLTFTHLANVYRFGVGEKLSLQDLEIFEETSIDRPRVDHRGIVCPNGIITFYEDIYYEQGKDTLLLAASYHFQTAPSNSRSMCIRFEYDPLVNFEVDSPEKQNTRLFESGPPYETEAKPIFHYHFHNFNHFGSSHFPAGRFDVPDRMDFGRSEPKKYIDATPPVLDLEQFLSLLRNADLI